MSLLNLITRLVKDPPPAHVFEISDAGLAYAHSGHTHFEPFPENKPDALASLVARLAPLNGHKRRPAAILLPDSVARISVLDFDAFPETAAERLALVRFRVKKTIPFDIDSAAVSFHVQPGSGRKGKTEVVAVTVALEVLARYEALFRNAGFHPGDVTVSALAALNLHKGDDAAVLAKLAGKVLTVMVVAAGKLKLFRCLPLEDGSAEEIQEVLYPTFAYAEDQLGTPVRRLILCGFKDTPPGLPCEAEPLRGRQGSPSAFEAGLFGYLEIA